MPTATLLAFLILLALASAAYGAHRFALYLESRDLIYYLRPPAGGGGYNPLQEFVEPRACHVEEVKEQRLGHSESEPGAPPISHGTTTDQHGTSGN